MLFFIKSSVSKKKSDIACIFLQFSLMSDLIEYSWILIVASPFNLQWHHTHVASGKFHCTLVREWKWTKQIRSLVTRKTVFTLRISWKGLENSWMSLDYTLRNIALWHPSHYSSPPFDSVLGEDTPRSSLLTRTLSSRR